MSKSSKRNKQLERKRADKARRYANADGTRSKSKSKYALKKRRGPGPESPLRWAVTTELE